MQADVIVNAANNALLGGGGVDGAIHAAGGPAILEECKKLRKIKFPHGLPTGEAVETTAGNLQAKWVIHTVGPRFGVDEDHEVLLRNAYSNSFELAIKLGARSIIFPSISTGVFQYPLAEAAVLAVKVAREFEDKFEHITFALFSESALQAFENAFKTGNPV